MINRDLHPAGWAALVYELEDAHEHLGQLIKAPASAFPADIEPIG